MINSIKTWLGLSFYTSELDQFLINFDQAHPKLSESQHQEIEKYTHINQLRDYETKKEHSATFFWDQF